MCLVSLSFSAGKAWRGFAADRAVVGREKDRQAEAPFDPVCLYATHHMID
jgi:hypothetical protein